MDNRLNQLFEIALVFGAVAAAAAILIIGSIWGRRSYHASRHAKTSRQRRRDATKLDILEGAEPPEPAPRQRSRRSRSSRRPPSKQKMIDLFGAREEEKADAPESAAEAPPIPPPNSGRKAVPARPRTRGDK